MARNSMTPREHADEIEEQIQAQHSWRSHGARAAGGGGYSEESECRLCGLRSYYRSSDTREEGVTHYSTATKDLTLYEALQRGCRMD